MSLTNLPGGKAARAKEELRRRQQWEQGWMQGATMAARRMGVEAPASPPAPPPVAAEFDARDVAEVASLLFDGCVRFGGVPHSISRAVPPRDPPTCDAVVFPMLGRFTVEECIRSGLISATGRFNREVHSKMMAASGARRDLRWARPMTPEHMPAFAGRMLPPEN